MELDIAAKSTNTLYWAPSSELEEIIQNVRTIITTRNGSVPLDREFGIDTKVIDRPSTNVQGVLTVELMETVEKYEPRVKVKSVSYEGDGKEGSICPTVRVVIL